jgi:hypothetical protein
MLILWVLGPAAVALWSLNLEAASHCAVDPVASLLWAMDTDFAAPVYTSSRT